MTQDVSQACCPIPLRALQLPSDAQRLEAQADRRTAQGQQQQQQASSSAQAAADGSGRGSNGLGMCLAGVLDGVEGMADLTPGV